MAYPIASLDQTSRSIDAELSGLKGYLVDRIAQLASGGEAQSILFGDRGRLERAENALNQARQVPGIVDYIRITKGDQGFDAVTAIQDVRSAIAGALAWLAANFPADANGYLLSVKFSADGYEWRTFPAGAIAGYRAVLQSVVDTIGD